MRHISVIGAGGWGTTLANLIAEKTDKVHLWAREKELVNNINQYHENVLYLKGVSINEGVIASNSLREVVEDSSFIIVAVPSRYFRDIVKAFSNFLNIENPIIVSVTKGLEYPSFKTMTEVIEEEIKVKKRVVSLSGPNHAEEVSRRLPTATVVASKDMGCLKEVIPIFTRDYFKVFPHYDVKGIEICGALKNIAAIATGISIGLGYGDNASASIMTLALSEIVRVGTFFGANRKTFYGLAGVGDLIATCTSIHSRNRQAGLLIAQGKDINEISQLMGGQIAEGIPTCKSAYELSQRNNIPLPLTTEIYNVLYEKKSINKAISDLIYSAK